MLPLELDMENFYCHTKSVINFDDFSAAVIVGKINGNEKFSNGAGKSTIFAAIKYVLFNEVDTTSLEKVIKHGTDSCKVTFTFKSSLDDQVYKIIRFRGRKPGAEVRLFRQTSNGWDDLTQRTSTETEKEIIKLLKISFKTFSNSVLFAQGDVSGIASMTPRERKTALKDALQLGVYSKYEVAVKKKITELTKEVEKNLTILSTLGDPAAEIISLSERLTNIKPIKIELAESLKKIENRYLFISNEITLKQGEMSDISKQITNDVKLSNDLEREVLALKQECKRYSAKLVELSKQENDGIVEGENLLKVIKKLKSANLRTEEVIKSQLLSVRSDIIEKQSNHKQLISMLQERLVPLPDDATCKHCRQSIEPSSREAIKKTIYKEIVDIENKISASKIDIKSTEAAQELLETELEESRKNRASLLSKEFEIDKIKKSIISASAMVEEFKVISKSKESELSLKELALSEAIKKQSSSELNKKLSENLDDLNNLKLDLSKIIKEKLATTEELSNSSNEQAVIEHKLEQKSKDIKKINLIKSELSAIEYQYALHQKVLTAFGPSGIPALITHTVLDDFQVEANSVLDRLRPGLRLQFLTENEKSDGEMADTLEITYFLNNTELEFSQLSGAQKLIVSLALRLGLAAVIKKRLGIDLRMILIDEADQSLDEAALETFEQAIKELQKDYKILIITHNNDLKAKFNHAIVVEQDSSLNSVAKVTNGW